MSAKQTYIMLSAFLGIMMFQKGDAFSQAIQVRPAVVIGEKEVFRSIDVLPRVFGHDSTGYYALEKTTRYSIVRYDRTMNKTLSEFIPVNEKYLVREIVKTVHFHDSIYLFFFTEGIGYRTLYVKNISKDSLVEEEQARRILRLPFVRGRKPLFGIVLSRDESKLLIYSRIIIHSQREGLLEMQVCEAGLRPLWSNSFRYRFERVPRHLDIFKVDSRGNAYMLDHLNKPFIPYLVGRTNKLMVFAVTDRGRKTNTFELSLPGMTIKNAMIEPAGKDHVIFSGIFSDSDLEGTVKGSCFFRMNTPLGLVQNSRDYLIPTDDFTSGESFGLVIKHLIHKEPGYSFMVAEQFFREEHQRYQNLYVCLFEDNGELRWQRVIPKEQAYQNRSAGQAYSRNEYNTPKGWWPDGTPIYETKSPEYVRPYMDHGWGEEDVPPERYETQEWDYGSFAIHSPLENDWIVLAFNDDLRNRDPEKKKHHVFSSGRKSFLNLYRIDRSGSISGYSAYVRDKKKKPLPMPFFHYDTKLDRIVFPAARRNNTFYMMELKLSDQPY